MVFNTEKICLEFQLVNVLFFLKQFQNKYAENLQY